MTNVLQNLLQVLDLTLSKSNLVLPVMYLAVAVTVGENEMMMTKKKAMKVENPVSIKWVTLFDS